jgi:hypothetical protein
MKNLIGLIIIFCGFFAPFLINGLVGSVWFFWIGFFLFLNPAQHINLSANTLKWARRGLLANMAIVLIQTIAFYSIPIDIEPITWSVFLDNVYGISGWVGNPVREAYDLIVPIPHTEMPDGSIAFEFSFMRAMITTFFNILFYLFAGVLVGKYIFKNNKATASDAAKIAPRSSSATTDKKTFKGNHWRHRALTKELLNLDYLIYSSHKSGTQTLVNTLNSTGFRCRHCHSLSNIDIKSGDFRWYLESYLRKNNKRLDVITVFREPMERHVSSFFQGYGTKPLMLKEVENETETIIYKYTTEQLQEKYISELRDGSLIGFRESIHEICEELQINTKNLTYNNDSRFGLFETEHIRLYLFRFDVLFNNLDSLLAEVTHNNIIIKHANMSGSKWYQDIYSRFKATLAIPQDIVLEIYNLKHDLINLFYSGDYESTLRQALIDYGDTRRVS